MLKYDFAVLRFAVRLQVPQCRRQCQEFERFCLAPEWKYVLIPAGVNPQLPHLPDDVQRLWVLRVLER